MRSLWRRLASRWLSGAGSAALSEDSAVLDAIFADRADPPDPFDVKRVAATAHRAPMPPGVERQAEAEASDDAAHSELPQREPC